MKTTFQIFLFPAEDTQLSLNSSLHYAEPSLIDSFLESGQPLVNILQLEIDGSHVRGDDRLQVVQHLLFQLLEGDVR